VEAALGVGMDAVDRKREIAAEVIGPAERVDSRGGVQGGIMAE